MWSPARIRTNSGCLSSTMNQFWKTASAVPLYQSWLMRCWGGREKMYSPTSGLKTFHPRRMWRSRGGDLYWIRTMMLRRPELMQLLGGKSMIRDLPPKGTGGLGGREGGVVGKRVE